jgi:hypothetical protein
LHKKNHELYIEFNVRHKKKETKTIFIF